MAFNSTISALMLAAVAATQAPVVDLGNAGDFAILAATGISTVPTSAVTGDIGVSPTDSTAITGFGFTAAADKTFATTPQVTGQVFASDYADGTPAMMSLAVSDMQKAYTAIETDDAVDFTDLEAGLIEGQTFTAGVYEWKSDVSFTSGITINGAADDVFIFKMTGNFLAASGAEIILAGGALAKNIFWQIAGSLTAESTSHLEGTFLVKTGAAFKAGSSLNGRILAQTAVTLISTTIVEM